MKKFIITIGCEYGADGTRIGKEVAEALGCAFYSRDVVDEIIREVGINKEIMDKVEAGVTITGKGGEGQERGSFSKNADLTERALEVQRRIVRRLSDRGSCVIIGRSADYILKDQENLLRVFIYTDEESRIRNIMEKHQLSRNDAQLLIEENDKRHHTRHLALTGSSRGERHSRDLLIDSNLLGSEGTAEQLVELAKKVFGL